MLVLKFITICFLFIIAIEDMRSRSVHWFWFPLLAVVLVVLQYISIPIVENVIFNLAVNVAFVVMQLGFMTLYFSFRRKRMVNITQGLLGWGDILFWIVLACYLPPLNFMAFYIASVIVVLILWFAYIRLSNKVSRHIPLAGLQALMFGGFFVVAWIWPQFNLSDDSRLLKLIAG